MFQPVFLTCDVLKVWYHAFFCDCISRQDISFRPLTHWGRVTHICVSKLTIIGSDNGLSPVRRQAIIWTNAGLLLIGPLGTDFSEILIEILTFSFKKVRLKVSSTKQRPFWLGLIMLNMHTILLYSVLLRVLYPLIEELHDAYHWYKAFVYLPQCRWHNLDECAQHWVIKNNRQSQQSENIMHNSWDVVCTFCWSRWYQSI